MRWPWSRKPSGAEPVSTDLGEAIEAKTKAEQALAQAIDQSGEIQQVAARSRRHRNVNHFAELISETFRGA